MYIRFMVNSRFYLLKSMFRFQLTHPLHSCASSWLSQAWETILAMHTMMLPGDTSYQCRSVLMSYGLHALTT